MLYPLHVQVSDKETDYQSINAALYLTGTFPGQQLIVEIDSGNYQERVHLIHNCCLIAKTNDVYVQQLIVSGNSMAYCRNINILCGPGEDPIVRSDDGVLVLHHCSTTDKIPNPTHGKIVNALIGTLEALHGIATNTVIPILINPRQLITRINGYHWHNY